MAAGSVNMEERWSRLVLEAVDQATRAIESDLRLVEAQLHAVWLTARGEPCFVREGNPLWSPALLEVQKLRDRPHPSLMRT